jgi:hypothetical protein
MVDHVRGEQADGRVMVLLVVPGKERLKEGAGFFDAGEALREIGVIFEGLELRLRKGIVVARMGPPVGFGDPEIGQQEADWFGGHRGAPIRADGELPGPDGLLAAGLFNEALRQSGGFPGRNHPADHIPAEDVEDDIELVVGPFDRPQELGDVP